MLKHVHPAQPPYVPLPSLPSMLLPLHFTIYILCVHSKVEDDSSPSASEHTLIILCISYYVKYSLGHWLYLNGLHHSNRFSCFCTVLTAAAYYICIKNEGVTKACLVYTLYIHFNNNNNDRAMFRLIDARTHMCSFGSRHHQSVACFVERDFFKKPSLSVL